MPLTLPWGKNAKASARATMLRKTNTDEENRLLDEANERWEEAYRGKSTHDGTHLHTHFQELDKIYRGNQWKGSVPDYKSTPVLNFTFSLVESIIPRLIDNDPDILVFARRDPKSTLLAEQLTNGQKYLWRVNNMRAQIADAARMVMKYGTAVAKTTYDPDFFDDMGEVRYTFMHPMNFFPDPRAYEIDAMEYCFSSIPKSAESFLRRWPKKGKLVIPDDEQTRTEMVEGASNRDRTERMPSLREHWFRDAKGRMCVMYSAGDVVLQVIGGEYDGSGEPVYRHNKFPFSKWVDYAADKYFWGVGEVEVIALLQRLVNSVEAQIIDNTRLMSNAQWIVNKTLSGLREEDAWIFNNRPGAAIFTHNDGVRKEPGLAIPAHVIQHQERLIFAMEQILGVHAEVQGRRPLGVRAASAIIALQESANVRVRQKSRNMGETLTNMSDQANWLMLEFWDDQRQMRIAGSSVPTTLNIREALTRRMLDQAAVAGLMQSGVTPQQLTPEQMDQLMSAVRFPTFDVEVKIGPSVPYSQALLYEQAKEFFSLGIIDRQAVLEATNYPGREQILARIEGKLAGGAPVERIGERTYGGQPQLPGQ